MEARALGVKAAAVGEYGAVVMLGHGSADVQGSQTQRTYRVTPALSTVTPKLAR